jgi:hypothetical protein
MNFSGRGAASTIPRPEILFSLSLEDNFDPPKGGWAIIGSFPQIALHKGEGEDNDLWTTHKTEHYIPPCPSQF